MNSDMHYAGGDLNLELAGLRVWKPDSKNATDVTVLKEASKNILYVIANSNAIRGDFVIHLPTWQAVMIAVDAALLVGLIVWGIAVIALAFKHNAQPEKAAEPPEEKEE